jgi:broad specificity phosphatase PhoE
MRVAGRTQGIHLSGEGRDQAERLAKRLAGVALREIYSSPLERAIETAEPLARDRGMTVQVSNALAEIEFGDWTGRTLTDLESDIEWRRFNSYRAGTRIPRGELMIETQCRMVVELHRLRIEHNGETVAVVGHGDPIRAAIAYFVGIPLDFMLRFEISPASVSVLDLSEDGALLLVLNETGDLPV